MTAVARVVPVLVNITFFRLGLPEVQGHIPGTGNTISEGLNLFDTVLNAVSACIQSTFYYGTVLIVRLF